VWGGKERWTRTVCATEGLILPIIKRREGWIGARRGVPEERLDHRLKNQSISNLEDRNRIY